MSKWVGKNYCNVTTATLGVTAGTVVTDIIKCDIDPSQLRVDANVAAVSVTGSVTLSLEQLLAGTTWTQVTTMSLSATGITSLVLNTVHNSTLVPLSGPLRLSVINTNALDTVTFTSIYVHKMT